MDHVLILKAIDEIPFGVGKKLLMRFLQGKENGSIKRNKLHLCLSFGSMAYSDDELNSLISRLVVNSCIRQAAVPGKPYWKIYELTDKGRKEIENPTQADEVFTEERTEITQREREAFKVLEPFLGKYNDPQKKAIISKSDKILCIAGAGSGKTTVLTKRIEFLANYRSVEPSKILAITFTRKARQEMQSRIRLPVNIETFNSYCEKILRKHNDLVYGKPVKVIDYGEKIRLVRKALKDLGITNPLGAYFTTAQRRQRTDDELFRSFVHDVYFLRDYLRAKHREIEKGQLVTDVCYYVDKNMKEHGLRDFSDQLMDVLWLFNKQKSLIPHFSHILVDEYQDVNPVQIKLLENLAPDNIFCVGDPRQSIFGWRGSDISYIRDFDAEKVSLVKNYRSGRHIVKFMNAAIGSMALPELEAVNDIPMDIKMKSFSNEDDELRAIAKELSGNDFVLCRTNKPLLALSEILNERGISHTLRMDDSERASGIVLATVHAIKGMEADRVFVIGCQNFPCRAAEHPVMEMVDEYDREEEERRVFYVAISRARKSLRLSYVKSHTYFITEDMKNMLAPKTRFSATVTLLRRLKEWRAAKARDLKIPAYMLMHDTTLNDIALKMPMTKEDLQRVMGLGPTKIMKYGDEILGVVCG